MCTPRSRSLFALVVALILLFGNVVSPAVGQSKVVPLPSALEQPGNEVGDQIGFRYVGNTDNGITAVVTHFTSGGVPSTTEFMAVSDRPRLYEESFRWEAIDCPWSWEIPQQGMNITMQTSRVPMNCSYRVTNYNWQNNTILGVSEVFVTDQPMRMSSNESDRMKVTVNGRHVTITSTYLPFDYAKVSFQVENAVHSHLQIAWYTSSVWQMTFTLPHGNYKDIKIWFEIGELEYTMPGFGNYIAYGQVQGDFSDIQPLQRARQYRGNSDRGLTAVVTHLTGGDTEFIAFSDSDRFSWEAFRWETVNCPSTWTPPYQGARIVMPTADVPNCLFRAIKYDSQSGGIRAVSEVQVTKDLEGLITGTNPSRVLSLILTPDGRSVKIHSIQEYNYFLISFETSTGEVSTGALAGLGGSMNDMVIRLPDTPGVTAVWVEIGFLEDPMTSGNKNVDSVDFAQMEVTIPTPPNPLTPRAYIPLLR